MLGAQLFQGLGWEKYDEQFRLNKTYLSLCRWRVVDLNYGCFITEIFNNHLTDTSTNNPYFLQVL